MNIKFCFIGFIVSLCFNCKKHINTHISGYVYLNDTIPAKTYEIGGYIQFSPRDLKYFSRTDVHFTENGLFSFEINKNSTKEDKEFAVIIKKKGYQPIHKYVNLLENKKIHLDTIFLEPFAK